MVDLHIDRPGYAHAGYLAPTLTMCMHRGRHVSRNVAVTYILSHRLGIMATGTLYTVVLTYHHVFYSQYMLTLPRKMA